jgi:hypothetical protein
MKEYISNLLENQNQEVGSNSDSKSKYRNRNSSGFCLMHSIFFNKNRMSDINCEMSVDKFLSFEV